MSFEKLAGSIREIAEATGESTWTVKDKLRRGIYRGRKSGRRTLVDFASVKEAWLNLPVATFAPPRRRSSQPDNTVASRANAALAGGVAVSGPGVAPASAALESIRRLQSGSIPVGSTISPQRANAGKEEEQKHAHIQQKAIR